MRSCRSERKVAKDTLSSKWRDGLADPWLDAFCRPRRYPEKFSHYPIPYDEWESRLIEIWRPSVCLKRKKPHQLPVRFFAIGIAVITKINWKSPSTASWSAELDFHQVKKLYDKYASKCKHALNIQMLWHILNPSLVWKNPLAQTWAKFGPKMSPTRN